MGRRLICKLLGHRKKRLEWPNGSTTVECLRCGRLLDWLIPVRYKKLGAIGPVLAMQECINLEREERREKTEDLRRRVDVLTAKSRPQRRQH